ncbi:MAG: ABC transporter ATP-binding protein [Desulfobacteraceae bacterium]|nr:ABC transporter ATP-binding protein [Desulfobacteraceae bacterium]
MSEDKTKLKLEHLHLSFGGVRALIDVSVEVREGEILSIIGPNGAGKTCVLNCINGVYRPQSGDIHFEGQNITRVPSHKVAKLGIARTFQNIELFSGLSVQDNLLAGRHFYMTGGLAGSILGGVYFGKAHREEVEQRRVIEEVIDFLEIEAIRKQVVGTVPYGLRKRVELGRALALQPKVLLMDEPMTGMNVEEKEDMARFVLDIYEERVNTIVLIEHDMGVVMDISDRVVVLDFGRKIAEGSPTEIKSDPDVIKAYLGTGKA